MSRRKFLASILGAGVIGGLLGSAGTYFAFKPTSGTTQTNTGTSGKRPAKKVTISEVSRHPSEMPDSPNYTLYDDDQYLEPVTRNGPINIEAHFYIKEGVAEIVEGTTMDIWTFNGRVPGPMIRAMVGDTLDIFVHNPKDSSLPHNIDFHAVTGPGGGSINLSTSPGAVSHLRVKLLNPGIYIYHCATPDIPMHIAHGMYGLVVVEPEGGLPPVDHEYYIMKSEFYTDAGGDKNYQNLKNYGHLEYSEISANLEEPTFVVFNGRPEALVGDRALGKYDGPVNTGETVRMYVGNIGPNQPVSFHVIGEIFDVVYVEGSFDLVNRNVQSTLIPAGGAAGVEFKVEVPGNYVLVDHSIFRIHKGALGILTVQGPENPDVYNPIFKNKPSQ